MQAEQNMRGTARRQERAAVQVLPAPLSVPEFRSFPAARG